VKPNPLTADEILRMLARAQKRGSCAEAALARRLAACVNALAYIPTSFLEKLDPGSVADIFDGIIQGTSHDRIS
jgi:hypothetical protein